MRPRKIWKRGKRPYYYAKVDGRQVRLELISRGEAASQRKLEQILKGETAPRSSGSFRALARKFLDVSLAENERETYEAHRYFVKSFLDTVGDRPVSRLCEEDLDSWCRKMAQDGGKVNAGGRAGGKRKRTPWSEATQSRGRAVILAVLNYGTRKLGLPAHPLIHVKPGSVAPRQCYLKPEERAALSAAVSGSFGEYLLALEQTGARPFSEVAKVTAADLDLEAATWTLERWKNSKKQPGKKRIIHLSEEMVHLSRKLALKYPTGPLFRNERGRPWTRQAITARFRALSHRTGLSVTAYAYRHTAITDALVRGVPVALVAELFGTSIQTISRTYAHVEKRPEALKEAMRKALGG